MNETVVHECAREGDGIEPSTKSNLMIDVVGRWIDTIPLKISNLEVARLDNPKSRIGNPPETQASP